MARLLVVHHSPTRSMLALTDAVLRGARDPQIHDVDIVVRPALEANAADVLAADGYLLGAPANFGYMAGALKHFFDSVFLAVGGQLDENGGTGVAGADPPPADGLGNESGGDSVSGVTAKRPFGLYMHGRYDTTGAVRSVLSITGALRWRQAAAVHAVLGEVDSAATEGAYELGATIAALLMTG